MPSQHARVFETLSCNLLSNYTDIIHVINNIYIILNIVVDMITMIDSFNTELHPLQIKHTGHHVCIN